eukprot:scaffold2053_cov159-Ochromonas_danica.AAC.3
MEWRSSEYRLTMGRFEFYRIKLVKVIFAVILFMFTGILILDGRNIHRVGLNIRINGSGTAAAAAQTIVPFNSDPQSLSRTIDRGDSTNLVSILLNFSDDTVGNTKKIIS